VTLDPNLTAVILAILGLASLIVQGFVLARTGHIVTTTDKTGGLVDGQHAAIVEAATTIAATQGFAAGAASVAPAAAAVDPLPPPNVPPSV
jgi:hypothetical protein